MSDEKLKERWGKYGIPEAMYQPAFDRCLVFQIPTVESDTFKGSVLIKPETTKAKEKSSSPRGVLVAAGLAAKDQLDDHGIQVGDIVWFARMSLWKHEIDAGSKQFAVIRAAEITGSEDLKDRLASGDVKTEQVDGQWRIAGRGPRNDAPEFDDA
jgi:hypothetical protein